MKKLSALIFILFLGGCTTASSSLLAPDDLYPPDIMGCKDAPVATVRPSPPSTRGEKDQATYFAALNDAWADCHDRVSDIKKRKELYIKQYSDENGSFWSKLFKKDGS